MPPYDPSDTEPLYHTYIRFQAIPWGPPEKAYRLQGVTSTSLERRYFRTPKYPVPLQGALLKTGKHPSNSSFIMHKIG